MAAVLRTADIRAARGSQAQGPLVTVSVSSARVDEGPQPLLSGLLRSSGLHRSRHNSAHRLARSQAPWAQIANAGSCEPSFGMQRPIPAACAAPSRSAIQWR